MQHRTVLIIFGNRSYPTDNHRSSDADNLLEIRQNAASFTSRFWPDVEQVLEQINVLVKLFSRLYVDVAVWRRTDDSRSEAHGQIESGHLVDVSTHCDALQVIQQVRQCVLQFHTERRKLL